VRLEVVKDYEALSRRAEQRIVRALRATPALRLGVATGASPARTYERLAHRREAERYIRERLLQPLGVPTSRYQGFRTDGASLAAEAARMSRRLSRHGPLDLCILGLGRNGHLLMNEPATALRPSAHVARLAPSTRLHTMLEGLPSPPRRGLTLGMGDILRSRSILLLVSGAAKRSALTKALNGRVTTRCPASFLSLHPDVTVICDREAAPAALR
jgi:galactosamine-6-phosphate isomerase